MKRTLTTAAIAAAFVGALWIGTYAAAAAASTAATATNTTGAPGSGTTATSATGATPTSAIAKSAEKRVSISNFTFSPATLEVPAGTTLRWVNDDDVPH